MDKYKVVFMELALNDLDEIVLYTARDSKSNAIKFHHKIIDTAKRLESFPKLGLLVPDIKIANRGFRMIVFDKYLLFYKIYKKEISIFRVLHGARNYPHLFSKMK